MSFYDWCPKEVYHKLACFFQEQHLFLWDYDWGRSRKLTLKKVVCIVTLVIITTVSQNIVVKLPVHKALRPILPIAKSKEISQDAGRKNVVLYKSVSVLGTISRFLKVPRLSVLNNYAQMMGIVQPSHCSGRRLVLCLKDEWFWPNERCLATSPSTPRVGHNISLTCTWKKMWKITVYVNIKTGNEQNGNWSFKAMSFIPTDSFIRNVDSTIIHIWCFSMRKQYSH